MESIPITSTDDSQSFKTTINSQVFYFKIVWKSMLSLWSVTVYDSDKNTLVSGIHLKSGIELINHFNIGIRNLYFINTTQVTLDITRADVGNYFLVVFTDEEIENNSPDEVFAVEYKGNYEDTLWSDPEFEAEYVGDDISYLFYNLYLVAKNLPPL